MPEITLFWCAACKLVQGSDADPHAGMRCTFCESAMKQLLVSDGQNFPVRFQAQD